MNLKTWSMVCAGLTMIFLVYFCSKAHVRSSRDSWHGCILYNIYSYKSLWVFKKNKEFLLKYTPKGGCIGREKQKVITTQPHILTTKVTFSSKLNNKKEDNAPRKVAFCYKHVYRLYCRKFWTLPLDFTKPFLLKHSNLLVGVKWVQLMTFTWGSLVADM